MLNRSLITLLFMFLPYSVTYSEVEPRVHDLPSSLTVLTWLSGSDILDWSDGHAEGLLADEFQLIAKKLGINITLAYLPAGRMSAEFKKGIEYDVGLYSVNAIGTDKEVHWGGKKLYQGSLVGTQSLLNIHMGLIAVRGGRCDPSVSIDMQEARVGILRSPKEIKPIAKRSFGIEGELIFFPSNKSGVTQLIAQRLDCILSFTLLLRSPEVIGHENRLFIRRQYPPGGLVMAVSVNKHGDAAVGILRSLETAAVAVRQEALPGIISRYHLEEHVF